MPKALTIARTPFAKHSHRANSVFTALKAIVLVAAIWGLVYPALLWGLEHLLQQA